MEIHCTKNSEVTEKTKKPNKTAPPQCTITLAEISLSSMNIFPLESYRAVNGLSCHPASLFEGQAGKESGVLFVSFTVSSGLWPKCETSLQRFFSSSFPLSSPKRTCRTQGSKITHSAFCSRLWREAFINFTGPRWPSVRGRCTWLVTAPARLEAGPCTVPEPSQIHSIIHQNTHRRQRPGPLAAPGPQVSLPAHWVPGSGSNAQSGSWELACFSQELLASRLVEWEPVTYWPHS